MIVAPLLPEDAPQLVAIARQWGQETFVITPGAFGATAKTQNGELCAFCLLRETGYGFVIDEIYGTKDIAGKRALAALANWVERTVAQIAADRKLPSVPLGGICRLDNPDHYNALKRRGYEVVAHVFAKDIAAVGAASVAA